jgi:hypothetical protein
MTRPADEAPGIDINDESDRDKTCPGSDPRELRSHRLFGAGDLNGRVT